jgi:uncharacterized caspase-like protein
MPWIFKLVVALLVLAAPGIAAAQDSGPAEKRIALVIGNSAYAAGALTTPVNDAGLIAQTLEAAGFEVVGSRDLDQDTLRRALRDFLDKAEAAGPDTVAFIYLGGYGLQLEGENYFVPIDARIDRDSDVPVEAIRLTDYSRPLAALRLKATIVVLDAARKTPFARSGAPLAGGLALVEPDPGMLIAFNAAPGTVAPEAAGAYGPYAQALAEMMREGGLPLAEVFNRTRLRVNEVTAGAQQPWQASRVEDPFVFFERAPDAPPPAVSSEDIAVIRSRPIRDFDAREAYTAALERDTLQGYLDFLSAFPDDPAARRVRAIVAARREAITWRRTRLEDTPAAYWSYLRRYPRGPHSGDARRRLAFLAAALEPPPSFNAIGYDIPPPPPEEYDYVDRPVLAFGDPDFAFAPPPPAPIFILPPPPPEFIALPPPPPPRTVFILPAPEYRPVPRWVRPPRHVAPPPPNNVIYRNLHNTVVVNHGNNTVTVRNPSGQTTTLRPPAPPPALPGGQPGWRPGGQPPGPAGARPSAPAPAVGIIGPALPPSVARRAATIQGQPQAPGQPPAFGGQPAIQPQPGQPLPGMRPFRPGQVSPGRPGQPPAQAATPPQGPAAAPQPGQAAAPPPGQPAAQPGQGSPDFRGRRPPFGGQPAAPQGGPPPAGQPTAVAPGAAQPGGQPPPGAGPGPGGAPPAAAAPPAPQPQQTLQQRQEIERQRQQQIQQQLQQQRQGNQQRQVEQQRQQQIEQQRQQIQQQQIQQQQRQQIEQQRQQQIQQQRQQTDQQRQQQIQQQRQQQIDQQRQQQIQQQRQQQIDQQRQQQIQQQRQQQIDQQRQQFQQRQQPMQQQMQQRQQQQRQQPQQRACGNPGQPPCPR